MINEQIDLARWQRELATAGRAQIDDFLTNDAAELLHECLARQVPWSLAQRQVDERHVVGRDTFESWDPSQYREHLHALAVASRGHYGFAYESYMMVRAYKEGRDPGLPLHGVLEFLNSPPFLAFARALTGHAGLRRVNAQATRYRAGHFLKRHNDFNATEGRQFAYVINLTRRWEADWGGLLQFLDAERRVVESFSPRWNTLSLFRVPAEHCVSLIAPWAEADRLAITGWFLA